MTNVYFSSNVNDLYTSSALFPLTYLLSTAETNVGSEEVQTVHSATQDLPKTESWTTVDPQLTPELFMTKATFGSEDLSSPSEEHQNTSTADASTGNMDLTSSHIKEPRSFSTVSPTLENNKTFEDHPQSGEAILMTDSLVTTETNAITSTKPPLDSSKSFKLLHTCVARSPPSPEAVNCCTRSGFSDYIIIFSFMSS